MAYVNVAEWKTDQVCEWLKGLDSCVFPYLHNFMSHEITGQQLLNLRPDTLEQLNVYKLGHQEIILEAVEYLRNFHYELDRENLQLLAMHLSCRAHSLQKELYYQMNSEPVSNQALADVVTIISTIKSLVRWLERLPFSGHLDYNEKKADLLKLSLEMATCAQRDRFAEKPTEEIRNICEKMAKLADYFIRDVSDPMILQPAALDLATLKKKPGDDLGFCIMPSFHGAHQVSDIKCGSAAHQCRKIEEGDEIVQVNYQTVVGWERNSVLELFRESPADILLTLKRRPRHTKVYGQIYIKPYRLPSNKKTPYASRWYHNLPSPRPELLTIPDFSMPLMKNSSHVSIKKPASLVDVSDTASSSEEGDCDSENEAPASVKSYAPKRRSVVRRRATITGASPTSKFGVNIEQFWKQLKKEHSTVFQLRDKAASCAVGLNNIKENSANNNCIVIEHKDVNIPSIIDTSKKVTFTDLLAEIENDVVSKKFTSDCDKKMFNNCDKKVPLEELHQISDISSNFSISISHNNNNNNFENKFQNLSKNNCITSKTNNPISNELSKFSCNISDQKCERIVQNCFINNSFNNEESPVKGNDVQKGLNIVGNVAKRINDIEKNFISKSIEVTENKSTKSKETLDEMMLMKINDIDINDFLDAIDTNSGTLTCEEDSGTDYNSSAENYSDEIKILGKDKSKKIDLKYENKPEVAKRHCFENNETKVLETVPVPNSSLDKFKHQSDENKNIFISSPDPACGGEKKFEKINKNYRSLNSRRQKNDSNLDNINATSLDTIETSEFAHQDIATHSQRILINQPDQSKKLKLPEPPPRKYYTKSPLLFAHDNPSTSQTNIQNLEPASSNVKLKIEQKHLDNEDEVEKIETYPNVSSRFGVYSCSAVQQQADTDAFSKIQPDFNKKMSTTDTYYCASPTRQADFFNGFDKARNTAVSSPVFKESKQDLSRSLNMDSPDAIISREIKLNEGKIGTLEREKGQEKKFANRTLMASRWGTTSSGHSEKCNSPKRARRGNSASAKRRNVSPKDISPAELEGWLIHRGRGPRGAWAKAWCMLKGSYLYRFKTVIATKADCFIILTGFTASEAREIKSRKHAFKVYHTGTVFYFAADTEDALSLWLDAINKATLGAEAKNRTSILFSETDDSDSDVKPKVKTVSQDSKPFIEKAFGSLKKIAKNEQNPKDEENAGTSLDRKYLKFLGSKTQNVPVPTSQFRSYRRVLPTSSSKRAQTKINLPDAQVTIAGSTFYGLQSLVPSRSSNDILTSSVNIGDYNQSVESQKNLPNTPSGDLHGFMTLEQFMLSRRQDDGNFGNNVSSRANERSNDSILSERNTAEDGQKMFESSSLQNAYAPEYVHSMNQNIIKNKLPNNSNYYKNSWETRQWQIEKNFETNFDASKNKNAKENLEYTFFRDNSKENSSLSFPRTAEFPEPYSDFKQNTNRPLLAQDNHGFLNVCEDATCSNCLEVARSPKKKPVSRSGSFSIFDRRKKDQVYPEKLVDSSTLNSKKYKEEKSNFRDHYHKQYSHLSPKYEHEQANDTSQVHFEKSPKKNNKFLNFFGNKSPQKANAYGIPQEQQKTLLGSPRLHRAIFRDKSANQTGIKGEGKSIMCKEEQKSNITTCSRTIQTDFSSSSCGFSCPTDFTADTPLPPFYPNRPCSQKKACNYRLGALPNLPYIPPPTSPPPDYSGLEYPPVFEPGTYSLCKNSFHKNLSKKNYSSSYRKIT